MRSFETTLVDTDLFWEMALIMPAKVVIGVLLAVFILWLIFRPSDGADRMGSVKNMPYAIFLICRAIIYGLLFLLVFFYDFAENIWVMEFPEKISLSSAFVGVLAVYEAISGLISGVQAYMGNNP